MPRRPPRLQRCLLPPEAPAGDVVAPISIPLVFTVDHLKRLLSNCQTNPLIEVWVTRYARAPGPRGRRAPGRWPPARSGTSRRRPAARPRRPRPLPRGTGTHTSVPSRTRCRPMLPRRRPHAACAANSRPDSTRPAAGRCPAAAPARVDHPTPAQQAGAPDRSSRDGCSLVESARNRSISPNTFGVDRPPSAKARTQ